MLVPILFRIDQAIHHLFQLFARDLQPAWCAAPANGKQHAVGKVTGAIGDDSNRVALALDLFHAFAEVDLDAGFVDHILPKFHQRLFAYFFNVHFSDDGQVHGCSHDDLAPWVMQRGAAESLFLFERHAAQAMMFGGKGGGNAGGSGTDDDDIVRRFCAAAFRNGIHRLSSLFHGFSYQAHAPEFSRDENAGHIGLEVVFDLRDVHPPGCGAENKFDRANRAGSGTGTVTYAKRRTDKHAFPVDDPDRLFRAGFIAAARAETQIGVEHRVESRWFGQSGLYRFMPGFFRNLLAAIPFV